MRWIIDIVLLSIAAVMAIIAATCFGVAAWIYLWEGYTEFQGRLIDVGIGVAIVDAVYIIVCGVIRACPPIGYGGDGNDED